MTRAIRAFSRSLPMLLLRSHQAVMAQFRPVLRAHGITEQQFVEMRTRRDATLEMPVLILPAVQINIRAGEMPPKEDNGIAYAKIPLNTL